jgi:Tfp pilus assembly protein PilF
MPQLRSGLLACVCLFISGCQSPLFDYGFGSFWSRGGPDSVRDQQTGDTRRRPPDGAIQQVSAEGDATSNRQQRIFQLLSQGNQELTAGRLPDAKLYFEQVLDADPTNFHAHHMLARIGDQTQEYQFAEGHYLAALSASPRDPNLLSDMGYSYLLQGEFGYANTYLKRAVTAKPDHVMARRNLAALAAYQGDYNTALAWLRQVGTEEQAQTTLRELMTNRPPQFRAKRDSRDNLPPDATPAARDLAEQLRLAKQQSGREQWKREMEEWARESRTRGRDITGTAYQGYENRDPRQLGQNSSDGDMQQAMRALEDEYSQRLLQLQQRPSIPPRETTRNQTIPQSRDLSEQMLREQMRREAEAQLQSRDGGQAQMVIPPPFRPQYQDQPPIQTQNQQYQNQFESQQLPPQQLPPQQLPPQQYQPQSQQYQPQPTQYQTQPPQYQPQTPRYQPQTQYQDPRTVPNPGGAGQSGLNPVPNQHQLELLPPPADYRQAVPSTGNPVRPTDYVDPRSRNGAWSPQGEPGAAWNPQNGNSGASGPARPAEDNSIASQRALALGMSAGPGSLFPMGPSPQTQTQPGRPEQQSFSGALPIQQVPQRGTILQPTQQQPTQQQPTQQQPGQQQPGQFQPSAAQPGPAMSGQPRWSVGQVYSPPNGGESNINRDWHDQQAQSPTWSHSTSQPINPQQHWRQPQPVADAWRNNGPMTSPTTQPGFGQPQFVAREQQQMRSTTPASQAGAPASASFR